MYNPYYFALEILHKGFLKVFGNSIEGTVECEKDPDKASETIINILNSPKPSMIARFGSTELACLVNYLGIVNQDKSVLKYVIGKQSQWWWNQKIMDQMQRWSGFFPPTEDNLCKFCELMMNDMKEIDVLGCWMKEESLFKDYMNNPARVGLGTMEPFWAKNPWTKALEGRNILVIHPFANSIRYQYENHREHIFENMNILPEFGKLTVIRAVQSLGGQNTGFKNWFEALQWMKDEMDNVDYEIALIGCGAYGFPLAAYAKRKGKKAVHIGGSLQLLFGIAGKRWEKREHIKLMNNFWIHPKQEDFSKSLLNVENGCYI